MKPKGWRNESRRHSLASKGIKTAQKIPRMPKNPTKQDSKWITRKRKGDEFVSDIIEWIKGDEFVTVGKAKEINDSGKLETFWFVEKGKIRKPFNKVQMRNVFDDKKIALYNAKEMRGEVKW